MLPSESECCFGSTGRWNQLCVERSNSSQPIACSTVSRHWREGWKHWTQHFKARTRISLAEQHMQSLLARPCLKSTRANLQKAALWLKLQHHKQIIGEKSQNIGRERLLIAGPTSKYVSRGPGTPLFVGYIVSSALVMVVVLCKHDACAATQRTTV